MRAAYSWNTTAPAGARSATTFRSTDPATAYGPRAADGSPPETLFRTTGDAAMGADMS